MGSSAVASSGITAVSHQVAIQAAHPATCHAGSLRLPGAGTRSVARKSRGPTASAGRINARGRAGEEWCG